MGSHLKAEGYIDKRGRIQDALREVLKNKTLSVPDEFTAPREQIVEVLRKSAGRLEIKNADERLPAPCQFSALLQKLNSSASDSVT